MFVLPGLAIAKKFHKQKKIFLFHLKNAFKLPLFCGTPVAEHIKVSQTQTTLKV